MEEEKRKKKALPKNFWLRYSKSAGERHLVGLIGSCLVALRKCLCNMLAK